MEVIDNVIRAYEAVKLNDVSKGIIALCTFVAVCNRMEGGFQRG